MNWPLTSNYTRLSGHKHQRRNKCFSASYVLLFFYLGTLWHPCVKVQNHFSHRTLPFLSFLPPPLVSSPTSPPPSHGLRELLAIWMLALYCEHSLIASALPAASRASQHGAPAVCLICHCSVDIHRETKNKKTAEEEWRERRRVRDRERESKRAREMERGSVYKKLSKLPEASSRIICFLSLSVSLSAPCSSRSQSQSMACSTRLRLVLF